jgi:drug/metabolite transporter (DMT)-like permease
MNLKLGLWCVLYVGVAMSASILKQYLDINGVSDNTTFLSSQVTFLGYAFSGTNVITDEDPMLKFKGKRESSLLYVIGYALILILGTYLCNLGLSMCGSGIFQVLYSSILIFTAIISYFTTGKGKNFVQSVGILLIFGGLASSAIPHLSSGDGNNVLFGVGISLLGTFVLSLSYIIDEYLMDNQERFQISAKEFSFKAGGLAFLCLLVYQLITVAPNFKELTSSITDWNIVLILFVLQFLADAFNNITYYVVIAQVGSTACGVMQGLVSVGVFGMSAILFCSTQSHQCFTPLKALSTFIVVLGVFVYSFGSRSQAETTKEKKE